MTEETLKARSPQQQRILKFKRVKLDKIYFKSCISKAFRTKPIPDTIRRQRNTQIILLFLALILALGALPLYFVRKSRLIIFAIVLSILITLVGIIGTLRVNVLMILINAVLNMALIGAFIVYSLMDIIFQKAHQEGVESGVWSDKGIMLLMSLPFVLIWLIGIHSMYLGNLIYTELRLRRKHSHLQPLLGNALHLDIPQQPDEVDLLDVAQGINDQELCIICIQSPKDSMFYPCGHQQTCFECG